MSDCDSTSVELMWATFDKVRCINMLSRPDRRKRATERFNLVNVDVEYFDAVRHPTDPREGCADSHRQCIQEAYDAGSSNVLIFEDDVVFNDGWETVVRDCCAMIKSGKPFDAIFLGCSPYYIIDNYAEFWCGVCALTHAYCISREGMAKYLAKKWTQPRCNHDLLQGMYWSSIYMHKSNKTITQEFMDSDNDWGYGWNPPYREWIQTKVFPHLMNILDPLVVWSRVIPIRLRGLCKPIGNTPIAIPLHNGIWMATNGLWLDIVCIILSCFFGVINSPPKGILHYMWEAPQAYFRRGRIQEKDPLQKDPQLC